MTPDERVVGVLRATLELDDYLGNVATRKRLAELIASAIREAVEEAKEECAKVCDLVAKMPSDRFHPEDDEPFRNGALASAAAIRARGKA